jgi:outer membrane protein assembly factor BamB
VARSTIWRIAAVALLLLPLAACGSGATADGSSAAVIAGPAGSDLSTSGVPDGDWLTFDYNAARTGVGPSQTGITRRNIHSLRTRVVNLPGTVDSSAIQLHAVRVGARKRDVIVVTTTYGRTLAIDPGSGKRLWQFVPKDIGGFQGSAQITTASPVADPDRKYVYSASPDGYIHKVALADGHSLWSTRITFDPTHEKIPSALNIDGKFVVATTGGYIGDAPPYQGHVVLINRSTGRLAHVWNSLCSHRHGLIDPPSSCSASDSAIFGRAGGVVQPKTGNILVATGNAPWNGSTNWGDSAIELGPNLQPLRHWTPTNQNFLNTNDVDVGSTSPALLPGGLAVQGGKSGILALLDLSKLRGMSGAAGRHLGGELQDIGLPGHSQMFTAPVVWSHAGKTLVIAATFSGTWAYRLSHRRLHVAWRNSSPGSSPVLAGGLLYVYDVSGGKLEILSPSTGRTLMSLNATGGHWNSPIVVGGRIIEPVGDANNHSSSGQLYIYHLKGR